MLLLFNVIILAALGFVIMILFVKNPSPIGFATNQNYQIIAPVPLDKPSISPAALNNWINEAVELAFNFNYANQSAIVPRLKDYMSDQSIAIYNALFEQNEFLRQLTDKKLIVSVLARSAPNQVESGVVEGRYAQKFTMDVEFLYTNNQFRKNERKQLVFLILRVLEMENPLGVTIYRFEVKDVDPFVANQGQ
jgi:hypothetical protein